MAVGKSAVGRMLARKLRRRFVDLDKLIERTEGMKVKNIFAQKGEAYFRICETKALVDVLAQDHQVIATGGGAVLNEDNLRLLRDRALLICLTASAEILLKRVGSGAKRPLLANSDRKNRIDELLGQRQNMYARSHHLIDTTFLTVDQVAEKIIELAKLED